MLFFLAFLLKCLTVFFWLGWGVGIHYSLMTSLKSEFHDSLSQKNASGWIFVSPRFSHSLWFVSDVWHMAEARLSSLPLALTHLVEFCVIDCVDLGCAINALVAIWTPLCKQINPSSASLQGNRIRSICLTLDKHRHL